MAFVALNADSSGAPTLNGVNGSLCTVLDWALVQAGWTILYTSGNARVYQTVGGRLWHVNHDSAVSGSAQLAVVRGCEAASSATAMTDPYPTVAQIANNACNWYVSGSATATARWYRLYISDNFVSMFINTLELHTPGAGPPASGLGFQGGGLFGETLSQFSNTYNCLIWQRTNSSTAAAVSYFSRAQTSPVVTSGGNNNLFWMRSVDGSIKSSRGIVAASGINISEVTNAPSAQSGYQNRIYREPAAATCIGSSSSTPGPMSMLRRGYLPQLWSALHLHLGVLTERESFEDTAYNPAALFRPVKDAVSTGGWIVEETDTWNPY